MLSAQSDYFTLFGLAKTFTQDVTAIKARFYQLQQKIHPDKYVSISEKRAAVALSSTINEAYQVLCSPLKRALYLLKLHGIDVQSETDTAMPIDFLMEQIAFRERLADKEGQSLKDDVDAKLKACENTLSQYLDKEEVSADLPQARLIVRQMLFYARLIQEYDENL